MDARGQQAVAGVDVGGTFTDVVVVHAGTTPRAVKVPTTPEDQGEGVAAGVAEARPGGVDAVAHGTTTATNALLERDLARTVLVTTEGFGDVLAIGRQDRPSLYDLSVTRPAPVVPPQLVVTVAERTAPDGTAVVELTAAEAGRAAAAAAALEPESVAVSLLFSYAGGDHEQRLARALAGLLDGVPVTCSSVLLPEFREYERTSTCVLSAAVAPVMRRYLSGLAARLPGTVVTVMTSGGGTAGIEFAAEAPVHTLLSGPAAGVVAAGAVARAAGYPDALAFDMGGTSTDVCLVRDGRPEVRAGGEIGGLPFRTPAVGIHTVGAGGGSIAWIDPGGALQVGPRSAGARPGPACYGQGGTEPTVTDAHAALGHLDPGRELGGGLRLDARAATAALAGLPGAAGGAGGVLTVVRATMARALRRVSTEQGVDPAGLALVAYGGAGPLHATALARELGCAAVVIPPTPGVLSALGLLLAPPRHEASRTVMAAPGADLAGVWAELEAQGRAELERQGSPVASLARVADCRYAGQSHELRVELSGDRPVDELLHAAHTEAYGYALHGEAVELVTARVVAEGPPVLGALPAAWDQGRAFEPHERDVGIDGETVRARVLHRAGLAPGDVVEGPALVEQPDTTTLLHPGDRARVDGQHNLVVGWPA